MRRIWLVLLNLSLLPLGPAAAWAQGPVGPEFRVNTYTANSESTPAIAVDPAGNFVVVWQSEGQYVNDTGIFGQRFASSGVPLGPEFRVNTYTPFDQVFPKVAADSGGNFVVVWTTRDQYGTFGFAHGQRYASDGTSLGGEFRLNNYTKTGASGVGTTPDGGFLALYAAEAPDDPSGTFGQRFASSGAPVGPEFRVNSYTTGSQFGAIVAADSAGNFVVVWVSNGQDGSSFGVFGQRYSADSAPLGPEFRVNTYTTGHQGEPAVAASTGQFVVVWQDTFQETEIGIFGQRFASSGIPLGPEFRVNTAYPMTTQLYPSVAADPDGNFVVTWEKGYLQWPQIVGQRFGSDGTPLGAEFRVNTYTTTGQHRPAVAADAAGAFIVTWTGDTTLVDVFGQRFRAMVPVELMHFGVE
jgi:hypothetical protein